MLCKDYANIYSLKESSKPCLLVFRTRAHYPLKDVLRARDIQV